MSKFISPNGKVTLELTSFKDKTQICVSHSPEKCQQIRDINNAVAVAISERLFHRGWKIENG